MAPSQVYPVRFGQCHKCFLIPKMKHFGRRGPLHAIVNWMYPQIFLTPYIKTAIFSRHKSNYTFLSYVNYCLNFLHLVHQFISTSLKRLVNKGQISKQKKPSIWCEPRVSKPSLQLLRLVLNIICTSVLKVCLQRYVVFYSNKFVSHKLTTKINLNLTLLF